MPWTYYNACILNYIHWRFATCHFSATAWSVEWKPKDGGTVGRWWLIIRFFPSNVFQVTNFCASGSVTLYACAVMSLRNFPVFEYLTWCIQTHLRLILTDTGMLRRRLLLFENGFTAGHRTQNKHLTRTKTSLEILIQLSQEYQDR